MKWGFKEENEFDNRYKESSNIRTKYPDRIPVIVQKSPRSSVPTIDKQKFLVPSDISVAQLMWIIRKRIQLAPEKAIFLFVGTVLPQSSASMISIYEQYADEDGFLYIMYSGESTFGHRHRRRTTTTTTMKRSAGRKLVRPAVQNDDL